jgi:hypothetical protein
MSIRPAARSDLPHIGSIQAILYSFLESGDDLAEWIWHEDTRAQSGKGAYSVMASVVSRGSFPVRVLKRGDRIWLQRKYVREDAAEERAK